jgi:hypothetical protein
MIHFISSNMVSSAELGGGQTKYFTVAVSMTALYSFLRIYEFCSTPEFRFHGRPHNRSNIRT